MPVELSLDVPRSRRGPGIARQVVRERFGSGLADEQRERLLLIISELTTNALIHGRGAIRLRVAVEDGSAHGEVIDEGSGLERELRRRGVREVGGRGLDIVGAAADAWGVHEGTSHVWFEVAPGDPEPDPTEPELGAQKRPPELE